MTNNTTPIGIENTIPRFDMTPEEITALRALDAKVSERVRNQKGLLSVTQLQENFDHNEKVGMDLTDEDLAKGSLFEYAVVNTRDVHKDAYGVRGDIEVSHVKCKDVEEFKTAYIEAYRDLCHYSQQVWQEEKATDLASWDADLKAIKACGFSGSNLEQLKKYCIQTIPGVAEYPEDYFPEGAMSSDHFASLSYSLGCWHARTEVAEWSRS